MTKSSEQKSPQFDWKLFGLLVRKARVDLGYQRGDVFCESIYRRARVNMPPQTYRRIETGEQEPTATQFFGICLALFGEPFPAAILNACSSVEWQSIAGSVKRGPQMLAPASYTIPYDWALENTAEAFEYNLDVLVASGHAVEERGDGVRTVRTLDHSWGGGCLPDGTLYESEADLARIAAGEPKSALGLFG